MTPLTLRLIGAGLIVAVVMVLSAWFAHAISAEATAKEQAKQAATAAAWAASTARAQQAQDARQQENLNEADRFNARRDVDARALEPHVAWLRGELTAGHRLVADPAAPAASGEGAELPASAVVSADLYWRAVGAAREAAGYADCLRSGGELCAADYDALSAPKGSP